MIKIKIIVYHLITLIFNDNSTFNFKLGVVKKESISAKQGTEEDKDKVQNYSANINPRKIISTGKKFFNTFLFRQTLVRIRWFIN